MCKSNRTAKAVLGAIVTAILLADRTGLQTARGDSILIVDGTSQTVTSSDSGSYADIIVGYSGNGTLTVDGASLSADYELIVGDLPGSNGTLLFNSGTLGSSVVLVGNGGAGTFVQSGGMQTVSSQLYVGYPSDVSVNANESGMYSLSAGTLDTQATQVGNSAPGTFEQSGGVHAITDNLYLGLNSATGTYNLSGSGALSATSVYVGYSGNGLMTQSGGTQSISNTLYIAYPGDNSTATNQTGTFNLSDGTLQTYDTQVGNYGSGTFNQSGGTHSIADILYLGLNNGVGTYTLSGSGQLSAGAVFVGYSGTGNLQQTGGTNSNEGLGIAVNPGSVGTVELGGGTMSTYEILGGSGTSDLRLDGTTIQAIASTTTFIDSLTTAQIRSGGAIINTEGYSVVAPQPLIHSTISGDSASDGGLTKLGLGTLTLTGTNSYTGPTAISAGALLIDGANTGTGTVSVNSSATLGGAGTIGAAVVVASGGTFSPGDSSGNAPGTSTNRLTLTNKLTLASGSTFVMSIAGTGAGSFSQVSVSGSTSLASKLAITFDPNYTFAVGQQFFLLDETSTGAVTGAFANAPGGIYTAPNTLRFQISYTATDPQDPGLTPGNDIELTIVYTPEPSACCILPVVLLVVGARSRRGCSSSQSCEIKRGQPGMSPFLSP